MTNLDLSVSRNRSEIINDNCALLLDAKSPLDIFDYWNLRALGLSVIPIPIQAYANSKISEFLLKSIEEIYFPGKNGRGPFRNTTLIKGRSISIKRFEEVVSFYSARIKPCEGNYPKLVVIDEFPQIWGSKNREIISSLITCNKISQDIEVNQEEISIRSPKLKFTWPNVRGPKYATEISFRVYGDRGMAAEVLPEASRHLTCALNVIDPNDWRFSIRGIVHLTMYEDFDIRLSIPRSQDVFLNWLRSQGWRADISSTGKIAYQMLSSLQGLFGTTIFTMEDVLKLVTQSKASVGLSLKEVRATLSKALNVRGYRSENVNGLLQNLINHKVIALGFEIQCPICSQYSWHSLAGMNYKLQCLKCHSDFSTPTHDTSLLSWSYKTIGPFSLPESSYGVYSVLLLLRFLSLTVDFATTPLLSFTIKKSNIDLEVDIAVLIREFRYADDNKAPLLLIAECKTYNVFTAKDIRRMTLLRKEFPGSILAFATLRRELYADEIKMIRKLVERDRKIAKNKQHNPVLVLTGQELFSTSWPPEEWKHKGGKHCAIAKTHSRRDLLQICEASQLLHLDMDSLADGYEEEYLYKVSQSEIKNAITN
jgi:hypothetical protein